MITKPSDRELHCLRHALGLDDNGNGREYRNYYATDPGDKTIFALEKLGDMEAYTTMDTSSGLVYYRVTDKGKARVKACRPPPLSRSKKRYRMFLETDSGLSFLEWLKGPCRESEKRSAETDYLAIGTYLRMSDKNG